MIVVDTALLSVLGLDFGMRLLELNPYGYAPKVQGLKPNTRISPLFVFQETKLFGVAFLP